MLKTVAKITKVGSMRNNKIVIALPDALPPSAVDAVESNQYVYKFTFTVDLNAIKDGSCEVSLQEISQ